jgi:FtsP/CotA-like multicopper oxidase with cupredoxin domain
MRAPRLNRMLALAVCLALLGGGAAVAQVLVQCPGDLNGDAIPDPFEFKGNGDPNPNKPNPSYDPNVECMHLSGGDGFVTMADGRVQYIFGFSDLTGVTEPDAMAAGILAAAWPAPTIVVDEGKEFYLTLTNVGMLMRPDLFDPHTVHFHGFPQSSTVFDGLPESGLAINMGASLTYYYNLVEPGTYMYHCHVEATEHMQMGMLGNLYVRAAQAGPLGECGAGTPRPACTQFAYNDGDGSTGYDVEYALQLGSFDPEFHDASWNVQPLPFALMWDTYPMINGRGFPDTIDPNPLPAPTGDADNGGIQSQPESSLVTATAGQKVLLRLSNLNITTHHTLTSPSIPMRVVAIDAKELVADDGIEKLHYTTNSVNLSGGMSADVILDTTGVPAGDYYLYAANLQYLANNDQPGQYGGMMTKIVIN